MDDLLAGGGGGGQGAAVEALQHADDDVALGVAVVHGVFPGQLDLALVGLSAGVGEQHLVEAAVLHDHLADLDGGGIVVVVGAVEHSAGPLLHGLHDGGVAVAQTVDGDAAHEVQELPAVQVPHIAAFAPIHDDGHTGVVAVQIFVSIGDGGGVTGIILKHRGVLLKYFMVRSRTVARCRAYADDIRPYLFHLMPTLGWAVPTVVPIPSLEKAS